MVGQPKNRTWKKRDAGLADELVERLARNALRVLPDVVTMLTDCRNSENVLG
jgi:hypothetical protein